MTVNHSDGHLEAVVLRIARLFCASLLGLGLAYVVGLVGTWAVALPGVGSQFLEPATAREFAASIGIFGGGSALVASIVTRSARRGWDLLRSSGQLLITTLGLWVSTRHAVLYATVGSIAAVVSYGVVVGMVTTIPLATSTETDPRFQAVLQAPPWAVSLYFAVVAAPAEELFYRGGLLATASAVRLTSWSDRRQRWSLIGLLFLSSCIFGSAHLEYSPMNAATAGITGLIFGSVALKCRSVWPAVLAHAGSNFLIGL